MKGELVEKERERQEVIIEEYLKYTPYTKKYW